MIHVTTDDGVRLDVHESGNPDGLPVVLVAGFKAPSTSWCHQVPALERAGHRVLAVDLRGHGATAPLAPGVTMTRRAADLDAVLTHLDLTGAAVIGGSMGGSTVWAHLDRFGSDRIGRIVVVDQTPKMLNSPDWPHGFYGYDDSNRDTHFADGIPETGHGTPMWRRGRRLVRLLGAMRGVDRTISPAELELLHDHATADWRPTIAASSVPVLFVAGDESEYWPASHAVSAAALAPKGEAATITHAGHATNLEQPEVFNRGVLEFLAR
ncbi:alpha/beta hydrolase [Mariniluteicoccus endophyticus]